MTNSLEKTGRTEKPEFLKELDQIRDAVQGIGEKNPELAAALVKLYTRAIREVLPLVNTGSTDKEDAIKSLSPEYQKKIVEGLDRVKIDSEDLSPYR